MSDMYIFVDEQREQKSRMMTVLPRQPSHLSQSIENGPPEKDEVVEK